MPGRVLMVAYNFPPLGGVGILRTLKYATYLPDSGWQPIVLTARDPSGYLDEDALRSLPPDLRVERALAPDPVKVRRLLGRSARALLGAGRSGRRGVMTHGIGTGATNPAGTAARHGTGPGTAARPGTGPGTAAIPEWQKQVGDLWSAAVRATFYPDDQIGWVPFAIARGLEICRDEAIDVVYSSSPPVSGHLAAAVIARGAGLPWVADFRDPWVGNAFARKPARVHELLQQRIELRIVERAGRVVFASEGFTEAYRARYPWAADRLVTIPNGYDRADLAGAGATPGPAEPDDRRFHLVYGGSVYGEHELEIFLDGLELLIGRRPDVRDRLRVEFIGWLNMHNQAVAARYAAPERLGAVVSFRGQVSHREAIARMTRADALLQVTADEPNKGQIQSGKLLEYIGLDRPILAVVPPGHARALLAELDWGIVADPTPAGVADGIERLLATPAPNRRADVEGRYDRANLTKRFAAVLDEVAGGRPARPNSRHGDVRP
jgi:glycosyltransferase involved in cell wall biosynthesis